MSFMSNNHIFIPSITRRLIPVLILSVGIIAVSGCSSETDTPRQSADNETNSRSRSGTETISENYLRSAALEGQYQEVEKAVKQGVNINDPDNRGRTALMLAAYNGHTDIVRLLLEEGAEVDSKNSEGRTALIFAASGPYPETVEALLEWKADPNTTDNVEGWSALMFAAAGGHQQVVETLIEHGADVSLQDKDGDKAISFARENNFSTIVSLLEDAEK